MDTKLYHLRAKLWLTPRSNNGDPKIRIMLDNNIIYSGTLSISQCFDINYHLSKNDHQLSVEFFNKHDKDTNIITDLDKAVIIDRISFNDIESNQFVWQGIYEPVYPEPWATEQRIQGVVLRQQLKSHTYLGWNGKWTLTFSMPIFTWIHKVESLGWIYD